MKAQGVKRLRKIWVDNGYSGEPLFQWVQGLKKRENYVINR